MGQHYNAWHMASSFDWETLLPIIFFIVYGIVQFLGAKKYAEEGNEEEQEAAERARRIREEIRRKIAERKQASRGRPAQAPSRPPTAHDPTRPDGQSIPRPQPSPVFEPQPEPVVYEMPPEPAHEPNRMEILQERLREERARLEKARREQAAAKAKAKEMLEAADVYGEANPWRKGSSAERGDLRKDLLTGLRDPNGLRKAVLYREILGAPVGMRRR